jgi:hypothetical protein
VVWNGVQENPRRDHQDHGRRRLKVDNSAGFTPLAALAAPHAVTIEGVPVMMNLDPLLSCTRFLWARHCRDGNREEQL